MRFTLIHEQEIEQFFYWDDGVCSGMHYGERVYHHVAKVSKFSQQDTSDLVDQLLSAGGSACLTLSETGASLWREVKFDGRSVVKPDSAGSLVVCG